LANQARQRRVADQIQRELAEIIRSELKDPRVGMITLTSVDVSPDLAHAKVYFTTLAEEADRDEVLKGLKRASGFLRSELGHRIKVHVTPELHFVFDASVERGVRLARLIDDAVAGDKPSE
jgi:ribosome-binding factor A